METHPTPFPGKKPSLKSKKTTGKTIKAPKNKSEENPVLKQKRVLGTVRSTNFQVKTANEKPMMKPSLGFSRKQPSPTRITRNTTKKVVIYATKVAEKKSPVKDKVKMKKKSVCLQKKVADHPTKVSSEGDIVEPRTPVPSPTLIKPKIMDTPYQTADKCSNCWFDKLETSSYWLGRIELSETVGKHFASVKFFRLALECDAEPITKMRVELKKYLARHRYLSALAEWRDVSLSYGLLKDESIAGSSDLGSEKDGRGEIIGNEVDQEQNELKEQAVELVESKN